MSAFVEAIVLVGIVRSFADSREDAFSCELLQCLRRLGSPDARLLHEPTIFLSRFDCFNRTIQNAMQLLAGQVCRHVPWGVFGPRKRD